MLSTIRGTLALAVIGVGLLLADLIERFLITPLLWVAPSLRIPLLGRWQRLLAHFVLFCVGRLGGARLPRIPRVPGEPGTLILMNHQSLLDIPLVVAAVRPGYPRIITRKRYLRWIPLISHMVRLYQYPVVNPRANSAELKQMLRGIREAARTSDVPMGIFPEGTRTRDGEIGPFRTTGLKIMLRQRPWRVHVLVADGFWQRARFRDFLGGMSDIDGRMRHVAVLEWTDPRADPEPFIEEVRDLMVEALAELRAPVPS